MDTIFMTSENSKTSDSHRLLLNLSNKIASEINMLLYQILVYTILKKISKSHAKLMNLVSPNVE